jgi:hypothetical protein
MVNCVLKQKIKKLRKDLSPVEARNMMAGDIYATSNKTKSYIKRHAGHIQRGEIIPRIKRIRRMKRATILG